MNREDTERYINVVVTTNFWKGGRGAEIKFMYPALYRTSCMLDIRFFPYDQQECKLTISSWTSSKSDIDYQAEFDDVNLDNFIPNEEWVVISFNMKRVEEKFVCCPEPWVLLEAVLIVRRKPLYYIVNLVIPTSVITMVAVTGTLFTAIILNIHLQKIYATPVSPFISYIFFNKVAACFRLCPPSVLLELWEETGIHYGRAKNKQKSLKTVRMPSSDGFRSKSPIMLAVDFSSPPSKSLRSDEEANMLRSEMARSNWKKLAKKASQRGRRIEQPNGTTDGNPVVQQDDSNTTMQCLSTLSPTENSLWENKLKRRYALEWEYLATVLDRLLLIVFSLIVFVVTFVMLLVGEAMHFSYEQSTNSFSDSITQ
ncbi:hypothetical protein DICVIV_06852 [Dictyocaulus viviparus]|uniref:Uncharacterized protein n=1 Tax=Dictyocaulus viviparus TaxID=29172 RepID=A0A0D8XTE3_DICVI|nr:hypothetical protein DICVIV_06852 [Dictyocaulus viviparus]